jgi:hypothetical protein
MCKRNLGRGQLVYNSFIHRNGRPGSVQEHDPFKFLQEIDLISYSSQQLNFPNFKTYVHYGKKRGHVF